MFKAMTAIVIFVLALAGTASAQFDSTTFGGYVMIAAPNQDTSDFVNRWSVVKLNGYVDGLKAEFQYDLASNFMVAAQGCYTTSFANGSLTGYAGRTFTGAGQITAAPNGLTTEWWPEVFMSYSFIEDGLGLAYKRGPLNAYLVRGTEWSAAVTCYGFQALWQEDHAATVAYEGILMPRVTTFVGATFFEDGGDDQYSLLNTLDLGRGLGVYWGGDAGRVEEGRVGGFWDITQHIRLKAAYETKAKDTFAEIVCHF